MIKGKLLISDVAGRSHIWKISTSAFGSVKDLFDSISEKRTVSFLDNDCSIFVNLDNITAINFFKED